MSSTPTVLPPTDPAITSIPGAAPGGPVPVPGIPLPAFDNTLGALFIGAVLSMMLYGIICLQMFIYITSERTKKDSIWTRLLVCFIFLVDTVHQAMTIASMYRFLITDFLNPFALASGGAGSGEVFTYAQSISASCGVLLTQLFFSWRIWAFSGVSLNSPTRLVICILTVLLALFSFGSSIDLAINGFNHRLLTVNTPDFILSYKLSACSRFVFDVFITLAMTWTLYRSRSGVKRSDHVIKLLIMFTVNTNLLTTLLSISELATFLALPNATIYGGLGFLSPKLYFNTLLAALNSRDYMRNELNNGDAVISSSDLESTAGKRRIGVGAYNSAAFSTDRLGKIEGRADDSMTFTASGRSRQDTETHGTYEMALQPITNRSDFD